MQAINFVLDCSIAMTWAFEDEKNAYAEEVFDSFTQATAHVPHIWSLEVDNVLLMSEKRARISHQRAVAFRHGLKKLPIVKDSFNEDDLYELARDFKLTTYDASYLELALRKKIPIATLDKTLRLAAKQSGVNLYLESKYG